MVVSSLWKIFHKLSFCMNTVLPLTIITGGSIYNTMIFDLCLFKVRTRGIVKFWMNNVLLYTGLFCREH